jgi:hemerythrin-like domain-containing protein
MVEKKTLAAALEKEHRAIDGGIEEYTEGLNNGMTDSLPLTRSMNGLRRHIYLEEMFLFPPMRAHGTAVMALMVMLREHGQLWDAMDGLEKQLAEAADADAQLKACRDLLVLLDKHNSKEEPVIYAQADDVLSAEATGELAAFIAEGVLPDGWKCENAGQPTVPAGPRKLPWAK